MKVEKTDTTTIVCIEPRKPGWHSFTESTILIRQDGKTVKLEEAELKALERAIGGRFKH